MSGALALSSSRFAACVDPRHGGEIFSLVDLERGRSVLAGPPFSPEDPDPADPGFEAWVRAYRGGWQPVGPNVGAQCAVGGEEHAFHGRASTAPWEVESAGPREVVLGWRGHGLALRRRVLVDDAGVHVDLEARPLDAPVPLLAAEHLAFGVELLDPEVVVDVPAAQAYEWGGDGPLAPPAGAPRWPEALLLDGRVERVDRMPEQGPGRLLTVANLDAGRVVVANTAHALGYELVWDDTSWLRHLWLWREERAAGGPWRGRASVLVVEPASIPHDRGLAHAVESGEARWLEADETASYSVSLRPVDG
jgi:hypothetical protein